MNTPTTAKHLASIVKAGDHYSDNRGYDYTVVCLAKDDHEHEYVVFKRYDRRLDKNDPQQGQYRMCPLFGAAKETWEAQIFPYQIIATEKFFEV